MKGSPVRIITLVFAMLLLSGCEGLKEDLGIGVKRPPDEFAVYARAPLSLPPDYGLRPPAGATAASQAAAPREVARQAVGGGNSPYTGGAVAPAVPAGSPGMQALLERTGATSANADVRAQVNRESTILAEADQSFVERLMFWDDTPEPATVVDPTSETRRIQQNQALNKPLTEGQTPTIRRKERALMEGIFN